MTLQAGHEPVSCLVPPTVPSKGNHLISGGLIATVPTCSPLFIRFPHWGLGSFIGQRQKGLTAPRDHCSSRAGQAWTLGICPTHTATNGPGRFPPRSLGPSSKDFLLNGQVQWLPVRGWNAKKDFRKLSQSAVQYKYFHISWFCGPLIQLQLGQMVKSRKSSRCCFRKCPARQRLCNLQASYCHKTCCD